MFAFLPASFACPAFQQQVQAHAHWLDGNWSLHFAARPAKLASLVAHQLMQTDAACALSLRHQALHWLFLQHKQYWNMFRLFHDLDWHNGMKQIRAVLLLKTTQSSRAVHP